jgi:hypothetical protein
LGYQVGVNNSDTPLNTIGNEVDKALDFIKQHWNDGPNGWYGNLLHPYAMWAVYKALGHYGFWRKYGDKSDEDFYIGFEMPSALGNFEIGHDYWDGNPNDKKSGVHSLVGDWYSHYCEVLVENQDSDGYWPGIAGAFEPVLATSWYINILNAPAGVPPVNTLAIDIMPGDCPNEFKCFTPIEQMQGTLTIAICGVAQGDFPLDVRNIDPATIRLSREGIDGSLTPTHHDYDDVATPLFDVQICECHDLNGDNVEDLVLEFDARSIAKQLTVCGSQEQAIPLVITANLKGQSLGRLLRGKDCIEITPCGCVCDLNCDGTCDQKDLMLFSMGPGWSSPESNICNEPGVVCECDLDQNGFCDAADGIIFNEAWELPQCYYGICDCRLVPDAAVVPIGGTLGFDVSITNMTEKRGYVTFGTKVTKPNGVETDYVWGPFQVGLDSYGTKSGHKTHKIGASFQEGDYKYTGYVDLPGTGNIAICEFPVHVGEVGEDAPF